MELKDIYIELMYDLELCLYDLQFLFRKIDDKLEFNIKRLLEEQTLNSYEYEDQIYKDSKNRDFTYWYKRYILFYDIIKQLHTSEYIENKSFFHERNKRIFRAINNRDFTKRYEHIFDEKLFQRCNEFISIFIYHINNNNINKYIDFDDAKIVNIIDKYDELYILNILDSDCKSSAKI